MQPKPTQQPRGLIQQSTSNPAPTPSNPNMSARSTAAAQPTQTAQPNPTTTQTKIGNKPIKPVQPTQAHQSQVTDNQLVENRITGLLDPNSALMRKAAANGMQFAASRGMQNSTVATEAVTSAMIDKALPIAQQDASTYKEHSLANAGRQHDVNMVGENLRANQTLEQDRHKNTLEQQSQQNEFTAGQNQLNRDHDVTMVGENLKANQTLEQDRHKNALEQQSQQNEFTAGQNELNRSHDKELESLRHQNALGQISAEGQQRLVQLEKQGEIDAARQKIIEDAADSRLSAQLKAESDNLQTKIDADIATRLADRSHEVQMNYANTMGNAMNAALAQYSAIYSNPEMSATQQRNAIAQVRADLQSQIRQLEAIYGTGSEPSSSNGAVSEGSTGTSQTTTNGQTGTGGNVVSTGDGLIIRPDDPSQEKYVAPSVINPITGRPEHPSQGTTTNPFIIEDHYAGAR